jgi:membrane associated rhomboid family serine protease
MGSSSGNRLPLVTLLVAILMLAGFVLPAMGPKGADLASEFAREEAQEFFHRHPNVTLTARARELVGEKYVDQILGEEASRPDRRAVGPPRLRARRQQQFDVLTDKADQTRSAADSAWHYGVNAGDPVSRDFFAYGFFHSEVIAFAISLLFFLVAGIGLEGAWGSLIFVAFCALALFAPALVHATWAGEGGIPFSGASGLLAALLAAYGLRGWGGRLVLPGWILLPLWLFAEYVIVRGVWFDRVEGLPLLAHAAGFGVGVLGASAVALLGLEDRLARRADTARSASNPVLALAARAVAEGQLDAAWSALSNAAAEEPQDDEVARAWWTLACEQGRAGEAVHVILPRMAEELRGGNGEAAIDDWFEIVHHAPETEVEARITTRLAEALIERGDSAGAREALRRAVEDSQGLTTALAQRVVRSARELDPELAKAAARVALQDAQLDPDSRESLEALVGSGDSQGAPIAVEMEAEPEVPEVAVDLLDRVEADGGFSIIEAEAMIEEDAEFAELALDEESEEVGEADSPESEPEGLGLDLALDLALDEDQDEDQDQDQDEDHDHDLGLAELGLADDEELMPREAADEWPREPGTIDLSEVDLSEIDPGAISIAGLEGEVRLEEAEDEEDEGDGERAIESLEPLELGSILDPGELESAGEDGDSLALSSLSLLDERVPSEPELGLSEIESEKEEGLVEIDEEDPILEMSEELLLEDEPEIPLPLRSAKILEGVPVGIGEEALEVDIQGRGRGRIPYERIEALAVAAVSGLSARPVLVMDLILNWKADSGEPFKLIRITANRFDPLPLSPGAGSPLQALKDTIATVQQRSGATCLPDPASVLGSPFRRFESLAEYEAEVLGIGVQSGLSSESS